MDANTSPEALQRITLAVEHTRLSLYVPRSEERFYRDAGEEIAAGERLLQMTPLDRANWQTLQGAALTAVISGAAETVLPMRAEDNWNIQTTALQVLQVLAAMTQHGAALLFAGGALKSAIRASEEPASIDITEGWPA